MIFLTALIVTLCLCVIGACIVIHYKQTPEAQLKKRLYEMITQAEAERAKHPKLKKNVTPTVVPMQSNERRRAPRNPGSFFERVIRPYLALWEARFQRFTPNEIRAQLEDKIFRAGKLGIWSIQRLITLWCLSIVGCTIGAIIFIHGADIHPLQRIFVIGLGMLFGAMLPFAVLNSTIRKRQERIRKQLPEFLDILCVSVQAGLSFDGAVGKMVRHRRIQTRTKRRIARYDAPIRAHEFGKALRLGGSLPVHNVGHTGGKTRHVNDKHAQTAGGQHARPSQAVGQSAGIESTRQNNFPDGAVYLPVNIRRLTVPRSAHNPQNIGRRLIRIEHYGN